MVYGPLKRPPLDAKMADNNEKGCKPITSQCMPCKPWEARSVPRLCVPRTSLNENITDGVESVEEYLEGHSRTYNHP